MTQKDRPCVAAMTSYPLYFVTRNPDLKSLKDLSGKDKIAVPSVLISITESLPKKARAGSLALISDAAHMLTDAAAIALALVAIRLAARPASGGYTYGLKRAEILSAQGNGATLLVLAGTTPVSQAGATFARTRRASA